MMQPSTQGYIARTATYEGDALVTICDRELLGRTIREGKIEMHISKEYFGGELINEEQALRLVQQSTIANLAGNRIVRRVLEARLASEKAVKKVSDVHFLMIFKFRR